MKTIQEILEYIVAKAIELNKLYLPDESIRINYSAIFCQDMAEYRRFNKEAAQIGEVIEGVLSMSVKNLCRPRRVLCG